MLSRSISRGLRRASVVGSIVILAACAERSPTDPPLESGALTAQGPVSQAALEAQINALINALYAPTEQGAIVQQFAQIKAQLASRRTDEAEANIVTFVQMLLADEAAGDLEDPNGDQPPSTTEALQSLVNTVAQFGGLAPPIPPALGGDQAIAVVGPAGGTVVTETGFGGVQFPAGALPENTIVVVSRLPNPTTPNAGPLPTTSNQYPLFYDFSTTPHVAQFAQPVLVGICQLEVGEPFGPPTQTVANRLQIAHPNPANPTTVELLAREVAPFVDCAGVQLAQARQRRQGEGILARALGTIRDLGTRATAAFRPTLAYAVHGGLGGKTTSFSPFGAVDPGGITPSFGQLAVGTTHACAIASSGQTWCWGSRQTWNPLGDGAAPSATVSAPVLVSGNPQFTQITSSSQHTCGLLASGTAMCWGRAGFGELGEGVFALFRSTPVTVVGGPFKEISANRLTTCAINLSNDAYCWGNNQSGELGNPAFSSSNVPVPVSTALKFQNISAGWIHTCGVELGGSAGAAHCWGTGLLLGAGPVANQPTPIVVAGGLTFTRLFAGSGHTCGLTQTGAAYCWGRNARGQLGDGSTTDRLVPTPVSGGLSFVMLAPSVRLSAFTGEDHTCGITLTGAAYCWGANDLGQLGDGTTVDRLVPTPVSTAQIFVAIGAGDVFSCGMTSARKVFCWGSNAQGELGSGVAGGLSTTPIPVPAPFN